MWFASSFVFKWLGWERTASEGWSLIGRVSHSTISFHCHPSRLSGHSGPQSSPACLPRTFSTIGEHSSKTHTPHVTTSPRGPARANCPRTFPGPSSGRHPVTPPSHLSMGGFTSYDSRTSPHFPERFGPMRNRGRGCMSCMCIFPLNFSSP